MVLQNPLHPELLTMGPEDLPAVCEIEHRAYAEPWSPGNLTDSLEGGHICLTYRDGAILLGYAILMQVDHEIHLLNLTINPDFQGHGHGRALLEAVMTNAKHRGGTRMFLEVRQSNHRALELYRLAGFRPIGLRRHYYPTQHGREDAIVMESEL